MATMATAPSAYEYNPSLGASHVNYGSYMSPTPVTQLDGSVLDIPVHSTVTSRRQTGEHVQSARKVSSTVVNQVYLNPPPAEQTREVQVQVPPETRVKYVTRKEQKIVPKFVPKEVVEYVERVVPITKVVDVPKEVEVIQYRDVVKRVPVPKIVAKPQEVIREVKVPVVKYVHKHIQVPYPVEVPQYYDVPKPVHVTTYVDQKVPLVVAQTIRPYIVEGSNTVDVDVVTYEPECIPIDIHVPRPVSAAIQTGGVIETAHKVISVPAAQYNTILRQLNAHLKTEEKETLPFIRDGSGMVQYLRETVSYTQPAQGTQISGLDMTNLTTTTRTVNEMRTEGRSVSGVSTFDGVSTVMPSAMSTVVSPGAPVTTGGISTGMAGGIMAGGTSTGTVMPSAMSGTGIPASHMDVRLRRV